MHSRKVSMRQKDCALLPTRDTGQEAAEEVQEHHEAQTETETETAEEKLTNVVAG